MNYGRYRVIEEIGHGGMGVVYRAHDPVIGRTVAIKVVRDLPWLTPEQKEAFGARFRSEAEAAGALHHPSIVTLYDLGDGYLVMEFVEGQTLASLFRARQRFAPPQVLEIASQVAEALDYAHARGIVHRGLKPANIMVLPGGGVKVLDFGVARPRTRDAGGARPVRGSAAYMAPEQLQGQRAESSADVYSLGVIVYELLAGQRPFGGTSEADIVEQITAFCPAPLLKANPSLPPPYEPILLKALDKDPASRYQRAGLFVAALREVDIEAIESAGPAANALPPAVVPDAAPGPSPSAAFSWLRARPAQAAGAGLAAVLALWLVLPRSQPVATAPPAPRPWAPPASPPTAAPLEASNPPSVPSKTVLLVTTVPPGARIFVGGEEKGQAPLTLADPPAGPTVVRAEKERYLPAARLVILGRGESQGLSITLEPTGIPLTSIDVLSMPDGGLLSIDGVTVGKTSAEVSLAPGVHVVEIRKDGFDTWVQEVEVGAEPGRIIATLEKKTAPAPEY